MINPSTLVASAAALAEELLTPLGSRWLHVKAVAEQAEEVSRIVPSRDRDVLVASAWLHDIGYAPIAAHTGFHPLDGARLLTDIGYPARLVRLVAHHSGAQYEAEERAMGSSLIDYPRESGIVMDALIYVDMTTGPAGNLLTFPDRIDEILVRYTSESPVYKAITRARPYLHAAVERTAIRLELCE